MNRLPEYINQTLAHINTSNWQRNKKYIAELSHAVIGNAPSNRSYIPLVNYLILGDAACLMFTMMTSTNIRLRSCGCSFTGCVCLLVTINGCIILLRDDERCTDETRENWQRKAGSKV